MNLTSKQRAFLKSKAMTIEATYHVGKNSITPELTASLEDALKARELIKVSVLKNCMDDPAAVAQTVAERTRSTLVQVIGRKFVLFKPDPKDTKYPLPK
ncbi:MAG: YhbY family RNA-binding protein [Lachnospiraceae bacterium]|nr:YhbY family RNA-binding protein [Lachnospiraceae bacterium]MBR4174333.1 YhbY family RNA-binding protein [Lachnospiraceae bacterium]